LNSYRTCLVVVAAELDAKSSAVLDGANLEVSIEATERVCLDVRSLLMKVQSMLECVRDMVVPDSMSTTIAGIVEPLAPKVDDKDPMNVAVYKQVTIGSESVFTMLMINGIECDFEKITSTYPKGKYGCEKSSKDFIKGAWKLATRLTLFLADRNVNRKAARDLKRTGKGASSNKVTGSVS
jgi:hypothetical protein